MDTQQWLMLGAGFGIGVGASWSVASWWFVRRLQAARANAARIDGARQFAAQQASQARKQIEGLQQELGLLRMATQRHGLQVQVPRPPISPALPANDDEDEPDTRPDGFADTQVQSPAKR